MKIRRVPLSGGRPKRRAQRPLRAAFDPRVLIWRAAFVLPFVLIAFVSFGPLAVRASDPVNLVTNGGFEGGTDPTPSADLVAPGSDAIPGWSVGPAASPDETALYPGDVNWAGTIWKAAEGTRSVELGGPGRRRHRSIRI